MGQTGAQKRARIGYDYVHSTVDDRSRLAYSEVLADEKGPTCAGFILRAADHSATHGITPLGRVLTDNHFSYRRSNDVAAAITALGAKHKFIKPHCPGHNGKVCEDLARRCTRPVWPRPRYDHSQLGWSNVGQRGAPRLE